MAGVQITGSDAQRIARQLGEQGKPLPAEMAGNPQLVAAYDQGTGKHTEQHAAGSSPRPRASSSGRARRDPARRARPAPSSSTRTKPSYASRALSPSAAVQSIPGVRTIRNAGDGGGLFLALVLYPLLLSVLKYGANGPRYWFDAKWLNSPVTKSNPNDPWTPAPAKRPPGWKGQWPPPGQTTPAPGTVPE